MQSNNSELTGSESDFLTSKSADVAYTVVSSETGSISSERPGLQILDEFRKLYETRIENVNVDGANAAEAKIKIMKEWIHDLDAQNTMLVRTVEELEEAACSRVKILEEKLKQTSSIITENIYHKIQPNDETLHQLSDRINQLERDESRLKSKVQSLECDIKSLLEFIRRAQRENCWRLDGLKFFAINTSEIPMPTGAANDEGNSRFIENSVQLFGEMTNKSTKYQQDLLDEIERLNKKLLIKDKKIEGLHMEFANLKDSLKNDGMHQISDSINNKLIIKKNPTGEFDEVSRLRNDVKNKICEITQLTQQLNYLEKELHESRDTLTLEVAEQHDKSMALKEKFVELEEQCRQLSKQLLFKDNIIKDMRKELKRTISKESLSHSPRKECNHLNMKVDWTEDGSDDLPVSKINSHDRLLSIKRQLEEIMKFITESKKEEILDKTMEVARVKTDNIQKIINNFDTDTVKLTRFDEDKETEMARTKNKLMEIISTLTEICTEKGREIDELEVALQNVHQSQNGSELTESERKNSNEPEISRQQFNYMEEFRVCTVEAQAATEDLREEMENIISNLQCRHQLFSKLAECMDKIQIFIEKTQNNLSSIVEAILDQLTEKNASQNIIISDQMKLKDLKNEINRAHVKFNMPEVSELFDRFEYEFDDFLRHLGIFMSKETYGSTLIASLKTQIDQTIVNLNDIYKHIHRVLHDNAKAQKLFDERARKLEKFEGELDFAHTKMQDTLENIIFTHRGNESSKSDIYSKENENRAVEAQVEELKSIICSKDTMLEHKDEIIRIQRQSIEITQGELNEVHQQLQSKIDAQIVVINQYQEDIKNLLEQRNLQSQTIKHLQDAIVEAKKNLYRHPQKSVSDVWSPITPTVFKTEDVHDV